MSDHLRRRKIFIGSPDAQQKASDVHLIRTLITAVYEKGMQCHKAKKPLPDSFVALFGTEAAITPAVLAGDADAFRHASEGGALSQRERIVLDVLRGKTEMSVTSTDSIKESLLANISCIGPIENPVDLMGDKNDKGSN